MKNFKRVLSLALAALMVIGGLVVAPVDAKADTTYTQIKDVSEITADGSYVIVEPTNSVIMTTSGLTYTTFYLTQDSVTLGSANELTYTGTYDVQWKIEGTVSGGTMTEAKISSGGTYLTWTDGTGNKFAKTTTSAATDSWTITETETDGLFRISHTTFTDREIGYNASSPRFAPYTGSQKHDLLIYKVGSAGESGGSTPDPEPEEPTDLDVPAGSTMEQIVELAYTLEDGQYLAGTHTLTGVITERNYAWSEAYGVSVTIQVGDLEAKPIYCYKVMTGEGLTEINVGDEITVTGKIMRYGTKYELVEGNLDSYEKAEEEPELPVVPEGATDAQIVDIAYTLASGQTLEGTYTLTGVVSEFKYTYNPDYDNIALWIVVDGKEDKPILCYKLKGEGIDVVKVGDTITVSGPITNYNNTIEFNGSTLDSIAATGDFSTTGIVVVLFFGAALVAVSVIGKRKMA